MINMIEKIYFHFFVNKRFYKFNKLLYKLSLNGLGILNYKTSRTSGEDFFITWFVKNYNNQNDIVLDIGAHIGDYTHSLREAGSKAKIYCFEPHPINFKKLDLNSSKFNYHAVMEGVGHQKDTLKMYDYANNTGSQHASLFKEVIEDLHGGEAVAVEVPIITIDEFVSEKSITSISLLKIDTEGNEYNVIKGARNSIESGIIKIIHFEFNEMNVISRTFFRDIMVELETFEFYRLLPDGLLPLGKYNPLYFEIFAFQNIIAINKKSINEGLRI